MSSSRSFGSPSAGAPAAGDNPTRQMLDEFDELMERMLSLPVSDMEEPLPPISDPAAKLPADRATGLEDLAHDHAAVPTVQSPQYGGVTAHPAAVPPTQPIQGPHVRPLGAGRVIVGRLSAPPLVPSSEAEKNSKGSPNAGEELSRTWTETSPRHEEAVPPLLTMPSTEAAVHVPRRSGPAVAMKCLLWANQRFDGWTAPLGGLGAWLRSARAAGTVLGSIGLLLLAAALTWLLHDWLGWPSNKDSLE